MSLSYFFNCPLCESELVEIRGKGLKCPDCELYYENNYGQLSIPYARPPWGSPDPTPLPNVEETRAVPSLLAEERQVLKFGEPLGLAKEELHALKQFLYRKGCEEGREYMTLLQSDQKTANELLMEFKDWMKGKEKNVFFMRDY